MRYQDFLEMISEESQVPVEDIKRVFDATPDVLLQLRESEWVRTPLGIFKMKRRKQKRIKLPLTGEWTYAPEQLRIKLQPNKLLCIDAVPAFED